MRNVGTVLVILCLVSLICSCGSGGTLDVGLTANSTVQASSSAAARDADVYTKILVYINELWIHTSSTSGAGDSGWINLGDITAPQPVDLVQLGTGNIEQLISTGLAAGHYQQIRLILALEGNEIYVNGIPYPLTLQSGNEDVKIPGQFWVQEGSTTGVVLEFDVSDSIKKKLGPSYELKPVIKAE